MIGSSQCDNLFLDYAPAAHARHQAQPGEEPAPRSDRRRPEGRCGQPDCRAQLFSAGEVRGWGCAHRDGSQIRAGRARKHGNIFNHAPLRTRKLLVHREEIRKLIGKTQQRGLTLIPTRMYFKNGRVKVELALAKGKQLWDKRETERRRTADKEAREAIARSRKGR
jgi:hypothetical protein